jgi:hypothetical protein
VSWCDRQAIATHIPHPLYGPCSGTLTTTFGAWLVSLGD